jgi:glycosyltransferase involved in cell wall biosynthesis
MTSKKRLTKKSELQPVFLISGKSPVNKPGGYAAYSHNLAKVLVELGHPVYIIAQGKKNSIKKTSIGIEHLVNSKLVNSLPFLNSLELAALPIFSQLFVKEIEKILKKNKIEEFIVWGIGPWSLAGINVKRKFKNKIHFISSYFTTFPHEMTGSYKAINISDYGLVLKIKYFFVLNIIARLLNLFEKQIINTSDIIVYHYNSSKKIFNKEFSLSLKKMRKLSYYVEIFERQSSKVGTKGNFNKIFKKNKTFIIICRQDPRKGINLLLHAFKLVREKMNNVKLIVIGSGSLLKANKKIAQKLGIEKDVIFTGFVANFKPLLKKADVFVFPTLEEGAGSLSILEAMKEGKAIITTKCDGIPEDIENNKSGILIPKMDVKTLANKMLELANNPKMIKSLGKGAKKRYAEKFSLKYMRKDVKALLSNL